MTGNRHPMCLVIALLLLLPWTLAPGPPVDTSQQDPATEATEAPSAPAESAISPGVVFAATLSTESTLQTDGTYAELFTLSAQAGETYSIWLASDDFDTVLHVYGPAADVVASDDDSYVGTNSTLTFTPNVAGDYRVAATSYSAGATGNFRLFVSIGGGYAPVTDHLPVGPLAASLDSSDSLGLETGWHTDYYLLEPTALGELVTITLRSAAMDSLLFVIDSDGRVLATDDNSAGGRDATVSFPWTPAPEQQFLVAVTSAEPDQFGGYFMERINGAPSPPPVATPEPAPVVAPTVVATPTPPEAPATAPPPAAEESSRLALDMNLERRLTGHGRRAGLVDTYQMTVDYPGWFQLDASSDDFDTYLQIYDERGDLVSEDDDSGRRTNSRIVVELAVGNYVAEVSTFDGTSSGTYEVRLREAALLTEPETIRIGAEVDGRWTVRHPVDDTGNRVAYYSFRTPRDMAVTILLRPHEGRSFCQLELSGLDHYRSERSVQIEDGCVIVAEVQGGEDYELRAIGSRQDDDLPFMLALSAQDAAIRWQSVGFNRDIRGHVAWSNPFTEWNAPGAGFTFDLNTDDVVVIHVRDTDLDARAYVTDFDGTLITSSNFSHELDTGGGLRFVAPHSGWYRLIITGRQRWFDTFTLRIDRTPGR